MTKGKVMISDLKFRTLSLFRRSSTSSTQSASTHSSGDNQYQSAQNSPTQVRKRPSSARSRSSLIVPRIRSAKGAAKEEEAEKERKTTPEQHVEPKSSGKSNTKDKSGAQSSAADHLASSTKQRQQQQQQQHQQQVVSSPLPLPTPEPSPLSRPTSTEQPNAPQLNVQPSTPEDSESNTQEPGNPSISTASEETENSNGKRESAELVPRNLRLDLGGRPRALSAGRRSLLETRPRSPLHKSLLPGQVGGGGGGGGGDGATAQTGQSDSHPLSQDIEPADYFSSLPASPRTSRTPPAMAHSPSRYPQPYAQAQQPRKRKIWVKRPNASATMVAINEDDMVDDARDMILRKYANSLGKQFDSPDVSLRIHPREQPVSASQRSSSAQVTPSPLFDERCLRPDEILSRTIDVYFPGGQSVEEALIIDTPAPTSNHKLKRTPRHSPGMHSSHFGIYGNQHDDLRPTESDKDYFPPMMITQPAASGAPSPRIVGALPVVGTHPHSIAVLNGGQLPPLPSPRELVRESLGVQAPAEGGKRRHGDHRRPKFGRQHTSSPTIVQHADPRQSVTSGSIQQAPGLSTPPHPTTQNLPAARVATPPPPRVASPRPKAKRGKKPSMSGSISGLVSPQSSGLLASVPPINVLVVEDNIINLKLLEAFLKRLKVRSHSAKDGREAVAKWRQGGFHLVLMDIQLPLMNGLEATKEIRRLERVNGVGAFVKTAEEAKLETRPKRPEPSSHQGSDETVVQEDEEKEAERNRIGKKELFKSPVIIVALTASSLHSDRSEALAAGCNDFLTKALIDFDGWRQWKDFQSPTSLTGPSPKIPQTPLKKSQLSAAKSTPSKESSSDTPSNGSAKGSGMRSSSGGSSGSTKAASRKVALQDLSARGESADSTATLDSMTSDDADSLDTMMPSRPDPDPSQLPRSGATGPSELTKAPSLHVQAPTPRQSTDLSGQYLDEAIGEAAGSHVLVPGSPRMRSGSDSSEDGSRGGAGTERRRRRTNTGQHARMLSAVGEETESSQTSQGSQGGDEVEVGA